MPLNTLAYWSSKTLSENAWHPFPGASSTSYSSNIPPWLGRMDLQAACVDAAPFIAGAGGLAHIRQMNDFGFTAYASIFRNPKTLTAMHRTVLVATPVLLLCQASGLEYRNVIPRWASDRERRRDEDEVRNHVDVGMYVGAACWFVRMYGLRWGRAYWAPVDVLLGGALADLMHREYSRAHGL